MKKILTIITIVYNDVEGIEKTIKSVINQKSNDYEYVIIDGGSTDGTIEIVNNYASNITTFVSEKDDGISDAFNKGIDRSECDWIIFMNAGDLFADNDVVCDIIPQLRQSSSVVMYGQVNLVDVNGEYLKTFGKSFDRKTFELGNNIPHQATFIKKEFFNIHGVYDTSYKVAMDFELFLRDKNFCPEYIDRIIGMNLIGGISQTRFDLLIKENEKAIIQYRLTNRVFLKIYLFIKLFRYRISFLILRFKKNIISMK